MDMQDWEQTKAFPPGLEHLNFGGQAERDKLYNARESVSDFDAQVAEYARLSRLADASRPAIRDVRYGQAAAERIDIFPAALAVQPAPLFIFIHGGYWRGQAKEDASMLALHLPEAGIAVCTLEYTLLPGSTLPETIRQVRSAVAWLHRNAARYGLDNKRFVVGGSSAGGHLSAMVAAEGWTQEYGLPDDCIKGAVCLSGLYDLRPLCQAYTNAWLHMREEQAWRVSPACHLPRPGLPIVLSAGGLETDAFKAQTTAYEGLCRAHGLKVTRHDPAQCNHFNLLVELTKADSPLTIALRDMVAGLPR
jgi:arylformamidase